MYVHAVLIVISVVVVIVVVAMVLLWYCYGIAMVLLSGTYVHN